MKIRALVSVIVLGTISITGPMYSQGHIQAIDDYVTAWNKAGRFNGCVLLAEMDKVLFKKGFGYADFEHNIPNRPEVKFNIGSISKQFTTALVFQLIEEGLLKLDGRIGDYLPDYRADTGRIVTIDHLLRHMSGLPCYLRDYKRQSGDDFRLPFPGWKHFQRGQLVKDHLSGDLQFPPGSRYSYSNSNFYLLYLIIEKVTGKSLEQNLSERLFIPLGLKSSGLLDDFQIVDNRACGYNKTPIGYLHAKYTYAPNTYGAGSLVSTVEDLFVWNRSLRSGRVLPERWQEKMLTPYHNQGPDLKHAYSIDYHTIRPPFVPEPLEYTSFDGALSGFITDAFVFPATDHTIILFDNSEEFSHTAMALGLYGILRGEAVDYPKPLAAHLVGEIAVKDGIDRACEVYQDLKRNQRKEHEFNSFKDVLSDQGYLLADAGRMDEALAVFRLIAKINPNLPDAYNDLGRVYQRFGKADLSREARQKAEELKAIVQQLYFSLNNGEGAKAMATVERMQKETPGDTLFESSSIGPIYADQLAKGKINESIQTCKVWALGNPEDVGPYFSLAIIYQQMGKNDEAKKCLEKVLQLDPAGRNAPVARMRMAELQSK